MKLVRYQGADGGLYGLLEGDQIIPLPDGPFVQSIRRGTPFPTAQAELLVPCCPTKIICVGLNYRDHIEECGLALPDAPVLFMKPLTTLTAHGDDIAYPELSTRVDFEAALSIGIGNQAPSVSPALAGQSSLGLTCPNAVTARD